MRNTPVFLFMKKRVHLSAKIENLFITIRWLTYRYISQFLFSNISFIWCDLQEEQKWPFRSSFQCINNTLYFTYNYVSHHLAKWGLTLSQKSPTFTCLRYKSFENTVGKGEIARNEQFLLFPVFSACLEKFLPFSSNLRLSFANSFILEE